MNLANAAETLEVDVTEEELEEMVRIGDFKKQGFVDMEDFMKLMAIGKMYDVSSLHEDQEQEQERFRSIREAFDEPVD